MGCKANSPCSPNCCKGKESKKITGHDMVDRPKGKKPLMSPGVEEKFEGLKK
jgi:hypothetical protein